MTPGKASPRRRMKSRVQLTSRPSVVHRQPARDALDLALGVDGEAAQHLVVIEFVDAAKGEAHFRDGLLCGPLLGHFAQLGRSAGGKSP